MDASVGAVNVAFLQELSSVRTSFDSEVRALFYRDLVCMASLMRSTLKLSKEGTKTYKFGTNIT